MLEPTVTFGEYTLDEHFAPPERADVRSLPAASMQSTQAIGADHRGIVAGPSADALQTTAAMASAVQRSVQEALRESHPNAPAARTSDKSIEIAAQIASILVLTQGLLNRDLQAAGGRPFDLPQAASADLDRLLATRRLIDRLAAVGCEPATCAVAVARIDAAIDRLEILVGIVAGKVGEVRALIAAIGMRSEIDQFETSIDGLLSRIRAVQHTAKPFWMPPDNTATELLIDAAKTATHVFAQAMKSLVTAIDGAAQAGARADEQSGFVETAVTGIVPHPASVLPERVEALPATVSRDARRWTDLLVQEHGNASAAAACFELDSAAKLVRLVEAIAARIYDPLASDERYFGGNVNYLFSDEQRVWNTSTHSVNQHAGMLALEQKSLRLLDELRPLRRRENDEDAKPAAYRPARRLVAGEVVIVAGCDRPGAELRRRSDRLHPNTAPLGRIASTEVEK